ncbi:MAG: hypothetical protein HQM14_19425 [SAR324 cluster bacterium]|nr:hypothetical protein [SAR324 cluster bacterium]
MKPINKIQEYLGLADVDYLAARLLILNKIPTVGLSKSAEALEKQFKLFFLIYEKITNNKELTIKEMKNRGHNLIEMMESYNSVAPQNHLLGEDWREYLSVLQESYNRRYPEHWEEWKIKLDINQLDQAYTYLRNINVSNIPQELKNRALEFGTFLGDIWRDEDSIEKVRNLGLKTPMEILELCNQSYEELTIKGKI